jgi:hypothetical protein
MDQVRFTAPTGVRRTARSPWLALVVAGLAVSAACSDDSTPGGGTAPSATVRTVTVSATPTSLPVQGGDVDITATVTSAAGANMGNQSVTFTTSKGTLAPSTPVTTDANGQAKVKLSTTESAVVRATAAGVNSSDVSISVKGPVSITTRWDPAEPTAGTPFNVTVTAKRGDADVSGRLQINYGTTEVDHGDISGSRTVQYTYSNAGSFNMSVTVSEADGSTTRDTQRITVKEGRTGPDDIDASKVQWFADCNVSGWPIEERVLDVDISSSEICVDYTGRGTKGTFDIGIPVDGTVWVFAQFNGVWYGATWDHLRPGSFCKAENAHSLGAEQIRRPPMDHTWVPRSGDRIGFMVSGGLARHECAPEQIWRTNIKLITWP